MKPLYQTGLIALGAIGVIGLGFMGYLALKPAEETTKESAVYGQYLWGTTDSGVVVYDAKTTELLLEESRDVNQALLSMDGRSGYLLVSNETTLSLSRLRGGDSVSLLDLYDTGISSGASLEGVWAQEAGYYYEPEAAMIYRVDGEELETMSIPLPDNVKSIGSFTATDTALYTSVDESILKYDVLSETWTQMVHLESVVISLAIKDEQLLVTTWFGSTDGQTALLQLNPETLEVIGLRSLTDGGRLELLSPLQSDNSVYLMTQDHQYFSLNPSTLKTTALKTKGLPAANLSFGVNYVYERTATQGVVRAIYQTEAKASIDQSFNTFYPLYR